jgi:signal transduction histidine kinase
LSFRALRNRFLWRLRAPIGASEIRRTERWLASARVFLAVAALIAIWMDPAEIGYSLWALAFLAFYIAQGVIIMMLLRRRQVSTPRFRLLVHSADIVWPAVILVFTTGLDTPFFLFFLFVLAAAAYRWGLWETLATAASSVTLLWIESFLVRAGFDRWLTTTLVTHHLPALRSDIVDFEPKRLFMRSIYLLVMGLLLGYLAEQQKQLRSEKAVVSRILGKARVDEGLAGTLHEIARELLSMYGASHALIASQETHSHRVYVGGVSWLGGELSEFNWQNSTPADAGMYLYDSPATTTYVRRAARNGSENFSLLGLDENGLRVRDVSASPLDKLVHRHGFQRLMTVAFLFGTEWQGRVFLFDPSVTGDTEEELRFFQELVRQTGPAVYNVYLLSRLRRRTEAAERARFARELHDGAVQSLIAVEMQVDVLRRQSARDSTPVTEELGRIQGLLREEVLKLRELMQQMKSMDVDSRKLLGFIRDTVERFQRETGISAQFVSELKDPKIPQPVCRELARIVQEALVNVRKHSKAKQVLVRLGIRNERWTLVIEDDGSGFPFRGKLSQQELENLGKGPTIIGERVRLMEGELTIESNPGQGSRLEISVPQPREAAYG